MIMLFFLRFLADYQSAYNEASQDTSKYLANPINAFLIVKQLTADWKKVEGVMSENIGAGMDLFDSIIQQNCILIRNLYMKNLLHA